MDAEIRRRAAEHGISISEMAERLLHLALVEGITGTLEAEATARLESRITRILAGLVDRTVYLSATAAIEAGTARRLIAAMIQAQYGEGPTHQLTEEARTRTVRALRQAPDQLLEEILRWHRNRNEQP